jgi:hypothetical protein
MTDVIERFESLLWHDSALLMVEIDREGGDDRVRLRVLLNQLEGARKLVDVTIRQCLAVKSELDLKGKRACRDAVLEAACKASSPWMEAFRSDHREWYDFSGLFHFTIVLVDPGGTVEILGKDFTVEAVTAGRNDPV